MGCVKSLIIKNSYRDSVFLMKISSQAAQLPGIKIGTAMMSTDRNKELFKGAGLYTAEMEQANPDDLTISVRGESEEAVQAALEKVQEMLMAASKNHETSTGAGEISSLEEALQEDEGINLALISAAGDYAKYEAAKALSRGLNVMLYSDNISLEDELLLKRYAQSRGLLVMGPDCGTAVIKGVPLAFANRVRKGYIGIVGASGTGTQEVMCLIHTLGWGISQAIGTGGRDLKDEIGGITARQALQYLNSDPETRIIVLISKPPGSAVRGKIAEMIKVSAKPMIVYYAGNSDYSPEEKAGALTAHTLEETSLLAVNMVSSQEDRISLTDSAAYRLLLEKARGQVKKGRFLRGVFGGGSLCYEAMHLFYSSLSGSEIFSNIPLKGINMLPDPKSSIGHTFLDMGEDEFTVGRPHPMIDPAAKNERIIQEVLDPQTAVVLFDLVIGYGSHPDPAGEIARSLQQIKYRMPGGELGTALIASVCGTEDDTPSRSDQIRKLREAGVIIMPSNTHAARLAGDVIKTMERGRI